MVGLSDGKIIVRDGKAYVVDDYDDKETPIGDPWIAHQGKPVVIQYGQFRGQVTITLQ